MVTLHRIVRSLGFRRFYANDDGNSAMEYAVMLGVIGATLLPVVQTVGEKVSGIGSGLSDALASDPNDSALPTNSLPPSTDGAPLPTEPEPVPEDDPLRPTPERPPMEEQIAP
ncbi:MAG: hypothetical protein ACK52S_22340 [Pirellula sp.]|jgi:Flp pilus assembly pilin Flp